MAECPNVVGVKNILMTFTNCDTGQVLGPYSHKLSGDELPMWRLYEYTQQELPGGYVKRSHISPSSEMNIIRDLRVPLVDYQGRSSIDVQVEYDNGLVYTGSSGGVTGDEKSDSHAVMLRMTYKQLTELLPPGAVSQQ